MEVRGFEGLHPAVLQSKFPSGSDGAEPVNVRGQPTCKAVVEVSDVENLLSFFKSLSKI